MLVQLYVKDLVLVTELTLEFAAGLSVMTGETGAGKSILLEALALALGERADSQMIRAGANQAEVSAVFQLDGLPEARAWLSEQALDAGDECALRRLLSRDGRTRSFVNGRPVTLRQLQALGERLVIIHAQNAHQALLQREAQQTIFDRRAGLEGMLAQVGQTWRSWHDHLAELEAMRGNAVLHEQQRDWLAFQVQNLAQLDPQIDEYSRLQTEFLRLTHLQELLGACTQAQELIDAGEPFNVSRALGLARQRLQGVQRYAAALTEVDGLLETAGIAVQEATLQLRALLRDLETDPARESWLAERLNAWHTAARKHQVSNDALPALRHQLEQQWEALSQGATTLTAQTTAVRVAEQAYQAAATTLSRSRQAALAPFVARVNAEMQALGLGQARFDAPLLALPGGSALGLERVEFLLSANEGQPASPLAKTASGGELARVSLAIQLAAVVDAAGPTLVFDEVDVGIGGRVAELVGRKLRTLAGQQRQVLCVTHQPQVAALGQQHYKVSKTPPPQSITLWHTLTDVARVEELARMLGGIEITAQTRAHAQELLTRGINP